MKLLVAIDGSEHTDRVIEVAARFAQALQGEVALIHIAGQAAYHAQVSLYVPEETRNRINREVEQEAQQMVEEKLAVFKAKGIPARGIVKFGAYIPADTIVKEAHDGKYDLVIVGSRGLRGIKELFLGSVSNRVAHQVETDILIVK